MKTFIILCFFAIVTFINCDISEYACPEWEGECAVRDVVISPEPCPQNGLPCQIRKYEKVNISFTFVPHFDSIGLQQYGFWVHDYKMSPLPQLNENACLSTSCPIESGLIHYFSVQVQVAGEIPCSSPSYMQWQLFNDNMKKLCCVMFPITIYD